MNTDPLETLAEELDASGRKAEEARERVAAAVTKIDDAVSEENWTEFHQAASEFSEAIEEFWDTGEPE